jgi:type IV secretion system protein VirB10
MCGTLLIAPVTLAAQQAAPSTPPPQQHTDTPALPPGLAAAETALNGKTYTVPVGTKVLLSLKSGVNTKTARPGDGVYLVSTFPVIVGSHVLIPSGVYVQGVVDKVERPGRIKGRAKLLMHFTTMIFPNGQVVGIPGSVDNLPGSGGPTVKGNEGTIEQAGSKGKDAGNVAKGGMIGATGGVIGGAASGSPGMGAAIGGLAGAAGGLAYTLLTRGNEIVIPEGTSVEMVLQRPLELQAAQLDGINDVRGNPQYIPTGGQPQRLSKPAHIVCPPGSLGCN